MIHFILSICITIYDFIDTLFVLKSFYTSCMHGTKKVEGILYKISQCHLQGRNYCLDLDLSNLRLLLIQDHIDNASTDFQLFKVPLPQVQEHLCQLEAVFIDGNIQQFPNQLCKVHSLQILEIN